MVLHPGTVVSGYRIHRRLGAGGMGTVYLADNPVLPRQDALKVLSAELSADATFSARFIREADLAASLDHPNIVTVYTRGQGEGGQLWIAMQYVAGSDVLSECDSGRMTPARAVHIVSEVAEALDYAHSRNLVHRDVKPANFLLSHGDQRVLLADFGIARALDDATGLTGAGPMLATVAYAAPEILSGGPIDGRADIYALACSLFKMLSGRTPFDSAGGMAAMITAHLHQPPPRVTDRVPQLPPAIDAVIARSLAKDPAERHQSAREFAESAAAALRSSPLEVTGPAPPPSPPPAIRRRRVPLTIAAAVLVSVTLVGALLWGRSDGRDAYPPQSFRHTFGVTEISEQPHRVAALGPGDADAVLSLGVQPVAVVTPDGRLPGWEQAAAADAVAVLSAADTSTVLNALTDADPDVIVATGDLDKQSYDELAAIAPTVTRPAQTAAWSWQDQLTWIGRLLGRADTAADLITEAEDRQSDIRGRHPAFAAKTVEVVNVSDGTVSDGGVTAELSDSRAARYLEGLGFVYRSTLERTASDPPGARPIPDPAILNGDPADVRIVVRTDGAAGGGGYNGLPTAFTLYRGITMIVDDPDVISALEVGGYTAGEFLDQQFVRAVARQVH